jgi:hypothetical protein
MAAITALKLVAYGNTKQNSDGSYTCQHGAGECVTDAYDLCLQVALGGIDSIETGSSSLAAWPFILCMEEAEGDPNQGQSCFESTMTGSSITWAEIETCASTKTTYDLVMGAAMKATGAHDYVPWVMVDNVLLENTNLLQKAICDAYTGTLPASCKSIPLGGVADSIKRSFVGVGLNSTSTDTCDSVTTEKACMNGSEDKEACSWCQSAAVGNTCFKESDAKGLPSSVFQCEYQ